MNSGTIQLLFALLRSAIRGDRLSEQETALFSADALAELWKLAGKHDVAHLVGSALQANGLHIKGDPASEQLSMQVIQAVYRYEQLNYEFKLLCQELEKAGIPFIPLKGSVLRSYYPEPWMRTSCDIDVLVHREDLERAIAWLEQTQQFEEKGRTPHDITLYTPRGRHIELHFDLVEKGLANSANGVLQSVWENATPREGRRYQMEMTDAYFYFYHIAHMAKHFEVGGCGIRPLIDLWILDHIEGVSQAERDALLQKAGLLKFTETARELSRVWLDRGTHDLVTLKLEEFILQGGVYGTMQNRVVLQRTKKGGRIHYLLSRIFLPFDKLKSYYRILEKYRWLAPVMHLRRWLGLLNPNAARKAGRELAYDRGVKAGQIAEVQSFLEEIGLNWGIK